MMTEQTWTTKELEKTAVGFGNWTPKFQRGDRVNWHSRTYRMVIKGTVLKLTTTGYLIEVELVDGTKVKRAIHRADLVRAR